MGTKSEKPPERIFDLDFHSMHVFMSREKPDPPEGSKKSVRVVNLQNGMLWWRTTLVLG